MEDMKKPLIPKESFGKRGVFICGLMSLLVFVLGTFHQYQPAKPTQMFLPTNVADGTGLISCFNVTGGTCWLFGCNAERGATDCTDNLCICQTGNCAGPDGTCRAEPNRWVIGNVTMSAVIDGTEQFISAAMTQTAAEHVLGGSQPGLVLSNGTGLESRWSVWAYSLLGGEDDSEDDVKRHNYIFVPEKFPDYIMWGQGDVPTDPKGLAKIVAEAGGGNAGLYQNTDLAHPDLVAWILEGDDCHEPSGGVCEITGEQHQDDHKFCTLVWNPEPVIHGLKCAVIDEGFIVTSEWTIRPPPATWRVLTGEIAN